MKSEKLAKMREAIRQKWVPDFEYVTPEPGDIPWSPWDKDLSKSTVAVVSTGGFYLAGDQPFDADNPRGDASYREVPSSAGKEDLLIAHTHYDHRYVNQDLNVGLPLELLREFTRKGLIGRLAETVYTFMGYIPAADRLVRETAPEVARKLLDQQVDAVLLIPV